MLIHVSMLYTGHVKEPVGSLKKRVGHRAGSAVSASMSLGRLRFTYIHVENETFNASPNIASNISRSVAQKHYLNRPTPPWLNAFIPGYMNLD